MAQGARRELTLCCARGWALGTRSVVTLEPVLLHVFPRPPMRSHHPVLGTVPREGALSARRPRRIQRAPLSRVSVPCDLTALTEAPSLLGPPGFQLREPGRRSRARTEFPSGLRFLVRVGAPTEGLPQEPALVILQGRVPLGKAESWAPLRLPGVYVSSTSVVLQRPSEEQGPSTGAGQGLGEVSRRAGLRDPEAAQAVRTSCVPGAADDFKP